jgi:hypothetical protein
MNIDNSIRTAVVWNLFILLLVLCTGCSTPEKSTDLPSAGRPPILHPDYSGIVIPPNIAPLNFSIKETGEEFIVRLHSKQGDPIRIQSGSGKIQIPIEPWKHLLAENHGQKLILNIFVKSLTGQWTSFNSVVNQIACESTDSYVVYRKFGPLFNQWKKMGIFQRCLESFDEKPIFLNQLTTDKQCMNCHNFYQHGTERWILHTRFGPGTAMLLTIDDVIKKIDTRTKFNKSPGGYPAWHPSGELIAFSAGPPTQYFHTIGETRDELDRALDIILYDVRTNTVSINPQLSSKKRVEVWPAWTPDGRYLFFCSAPQLETFFMKSQQGEDSLAYDKIQYDLMRISYNHQNGSWGELKTVVSSKEFGLSIAQPKISPDGRFLVFTASRYGSFPVFHSDADLYLLDLTTGRREKLALNSDRAEGYHSWSSNSRWLVFSSKREDGQFTRLYLSYIDSSGNASKAFILPQKDPQALAKAAYSNEIPTQVDPNTIQNMSTDKAKSSVQGQIPLKQNKMKH